jgi:hypothetical protein
MTYKQLAWVTIGFIPAVAALHAIGIDTIVRAVIQLLFNAFG